MRRNADDIAAEAAALRAEFEAALKPYFGSDESTAEHMAPFDWALRMAREDDDWTYGDLRTETLGYVQSYATTVTDVLGDLLGGVPGVVLATARRDEARAATIREADRGEEGGDAEYRDTRKGEETVDTRGGFVEFEAQAEHDIGKHPGALSACREGCWEKAERTVDAAIAAGTIMPAVTAKA